MSREKKKMQYLTSMRISCVPAGKMIIRLLPMQRSRMGPQKAEGHAFCRPL